MTAVEERRRTALRLPLGTLGLVAVSAAVFGLQHLPGFSLPAQWEAAWRGMPRDAAFLTGHFWALVAPATLAHNGWLHLTLNMAALAYFGRQAELRLGLAPVLLIALLAGIGGSGLELAISGVAKIGMSGVAYAFFGVFLASPRTVSRPLWLALAIGLLAWLGKGIFLDGPASGDGNVAHLTGLTIGIAAALIANAGLGRRRS